ncbi:TlpA family protein disulfide reductase [Marinilabilia salmonicolor]|uniref:TlpA family protein disulfide reductase n=1 Tax=Marinilabilia salmonicolor TaxID=989 RepID=UPI00029A1EC9|nr:TlpA disulfide reductase family protein [Marinilabilia salmonicolor]
MLHNLKIFIGFLLWLLPLWTAVAQTKTTSISGHAPEYKNMGLVFQRYQNFLTLESEELFSLQVDSTGHFNFHIDLPETTYAFADLGSYRGFIYLRPGHNYELKLPPFEPVPQPQRLNPFYTPEAISLGILNQDSNDLNARIRNFDDAFYYELNTRAIRLMASRNKSAVAAITDTLETRFPDNSDSFFRGHKRYRYARLEMLTSRNPEKEIIQKYYAVHPVQFNLPAYWDTFRDVFRGFGRKTLNKEFTAPLTFSKTVSLVKTDSTFQKKDISELLALWTIYQSYHEKLLPQHRALQLIKEASDSASVKEIKNIAGSIYRKLSALQPGSMAPSFTLMDFDRKEHHLDDYRGKFVYLNFMHTENYTCRQELRLLPRLHETFNRDLEIVTILTDDNYDKAQEFVKDTDSPWTFLHFGMNANILSKYNIKAVPQYFLINPDGKLILSPAPAPGENFHDHFIKQYRQYQHEQQRKNPEKRESIFGP